MTVSPRTLLVRSIRVVLALGILLAGLAKITSLSHPANGLSPTLSLGVAVVEIAIAVLLLHARWWPLGACASVAVGVGGVLLPYLVPTRACGCLGAWVALTPNARTLLGCTICLLGGMILVLDPVGRERLFRSEGARGTLS